MRHYSFSKFFLGHTEAGTFDGIPNCRMASYFAQQGRCYVTGRVLVDGERQLHHRIRKFDGGLDTPENTILLDAKVHRLIHCYHPDEIQALLTKLSLTDEQFRMVNQLRREANMPILQRNIETAA